jgi:hypothetical protein
VFVNWPSGASQVVGPTPAPMIEATPTEIVPAPSDSDGT